MIAQKTVVKTNSSKKFLREVMAELRKVSWPSKQELISNTGIVFIAVAAVVVLIWVMDALFTRVLQFIIK